MSLAEETAKEKGEGLSESFACCVLICVYSLNVTGLTGLANHTAPVCAMNSSLVIVTVRQS